MNPRAVQLVGRARQLLATVPGATSIQCNDSRTWTSVSIGAATDEDVFTLQMSLGLNPPKERRAELERGGYRWWLSARSERTEHSPRCLVTMTVVGPHHIEE